MPNIGVVLKQEMTRLSRREIRKETTVSKRAAWASRRDIATLKRKVADLERKLSILSKASASHAALPANKLPEDHGVRFVASGFRAHMRRLGLSGPQCGILLGVSEQTIYNWLSKVAKPRKETMPKIVAFRSMGKREAHERLAELQASSRKRKTPKTKK